MAAAVQSVPLAVRSVPLVDRAEEVAALEGVLGERAEGAVPVVVVHGEAGIAYALGMGWRTVRKLAVTLAVSAAALVFVVITLAGGLAARGDAKSATSTRLARDDRCRSSQLRLGPGPRVSERTEQSTRLFVLHNVSFKECALDGYPRIALLDGHGVTLPFRYRHRGDQMLTSARPMPVAVRAGGVAYVAINKSSCVLFSRRLATRIRLSPPGDEQTLSLKLGRYPIVAYCGSGDPGSIIDVTPVEPTANTVGAPY